MLKFDTNTPCQLNNSAQCADYLLQRWDLKSLLNYENLYAIFLDDNRHPVFHHRLNEGNQSGTNYDALRMIHYAYDVNSRYIILSHNHFSDTAEPSAIDLEVTKLLAFILEKLGMCLVDHIIISVKADTHFSFADHHLLQAG